MAYGQKYRLRYETAKRRADIKLDIYRKDYSGAGVLKKIGDGGIKLSKINESEKIRATNLAFTIQADTDFEYRSFFTDDNKQHLSKLLIDNVLIWQGYIVGDQYSEPYTSPPYDVAVVATDGLGLLKNVDFELTGMVSRFAAIRYCMDKIGLGIGYALSIDLYETRMNTNRSMLEQLYFEAAIFADKNCYEVLEFIIPEGCVITQSDNRWLIYRENEGEKQRFLYTSAGVYEQVQDGETVQSLGSLKTADVYPINGNLRDDMESAWKNFVINNNYGSNESFLENHDFSGFHVKQILSDYIDKWTYERVSVFGGTFIKTTSEGVNFLYIKGTTLGLPDVLSQSVTIKATTSPLTIKIAYSPVWFDERQTTVPTVSFEIKHVSSVGTKYLTKTGWVTEYSKIEEQTQLSFGLTGVNYKTLELLADSIPYTGVLTVKIFGLLTFGLAVQSVKVYTEDLGLYPDPETVKVVFSDDQSKANETIEVMPVDLPQIDNAELFFANGNYVDVSGAKYPAKSWSNNGGSSFTYNEYVATQMAAMYSQQKQLLSGSVRGENMSMNAVLQHAYNDNLIFYTRTAEWNVLEDEWSVELVEVIGSGTGATLPDTVDPIWGLITTDKIEEAEAVFYRIFNNEVVNKYGNNAVISGEYLIFPELTTDIFDRSDATYWSGLTIHDSDPRKWPLSELTNAFLLANGTAATIARLFLNDYGTAVSEALPIVVFAEEQSTDDQEAIQDYINGNQNIAGNSTETVDSTDFSKRFTAPFSILNTDGDLVAYFGNYIDFYAKAEKRFTVDETGTKTTGHAAVDSVGSEEFVSDQAGWRIEQNESGLSTAEFDRLNVRQTLFAKEFVINQTRATNGNMIVSNAARLDKINSVAHFVNSYMTIDGGYLTRPFSIVMEMLIADISDINSLLQLEHVTVKMEAEGLRIGQNHQIKTADIPIGEWFLLVLSYYEDTSEACGLVNLVDVTAPADELINGASPNLLGKDNANNYSTFDLRLLDIVDEVAEGYIMTFGDETLTDELAYILTDPEKHFEYDGY